MLGHMVYHQMLLIQLGSFCGEKQVFRPLRAHLDADCAELLSEYGAKTECSWCAVLALLVHSSPCMQRL